GPARFPGVLDRTFADSAKMPVLGKGELDMSLKNRFFTLVALVVLAISVSSSATETNCSNASLNGSYSLHATGEIKNVGPFAAVGRLVFDGNGSYSGTLWQRINGNNVVETPHRRIFSKLQLHRQG